MNTISQIYYIRKIYLDQKFLGKSLTTCESTIRLLPVCFYPPPSYLAGWDGRLSFVLSSYLAGWEGGLSKCEQGKKG